MVPYQWSARKLQPIVVAYVAAVFVAMMAVSHFMLHSATGVKALALGAVGFILPLVPAVLGRVEYRLNDAGLEKRPLNEKKPRDFEEVFRWDQLSHVTPMRNGFKYFKPVGDVSPLRRFWKTHVSDAYSGEFHVEAEDRDEVLGILDEYCVPTARPG